MSDYDETIRKLVLIQKDILRGLNEREPLLRGSMWQRLKWRVLGMPQEVREAQYANRLRRARIFQAELHKRAKS